MQSMDPVVKPPTLEITDLAQVTEAQIDLPQLADLLVRGFHLYPVGMDWLIPVIRQGVLEDLRQRLRPSGRQYACYRVKLQGQIIGTAELSLRAPHNPFPWLWNSGDREPYLANLAVEPQYQRRAVAQKLLETCEEQAYAWGYRRIYLNVMADNQGARSLYLKSGYSIVTSSPSFLPWQAKKLLLMKPLAPAVEAVAASAAQ
jgi:ribosomal protein S18 acetylase RimI-like enzyme